VLIEKVLSNLETAPASDQVDWLDLTWFDCTLRALKRRTRAGRSVSVLLPIGTRLRHGDVLSNSPPIAVNLLSSDVLVVSPPDCAMLARIALELGNLHVPVELAGSELIVLPDGPVFGVLERWRCPGVRACRRFTPEAACLLSLPSRSSTLSIVRAASLYEG
jgi:urease accessory protein UreE